MARRSSYRRRLKRFARAGSNSIEKTMFRRALDFEIVNRQNERLICATSDSLREAY
jgi:hypothetical protein